MSEQDRVRALLEEGKISQEEAENLLDVLRDEEESEVGAASENTFTDTASEDTILEGTTPENDVPKAAVQSEGEREVKTAAGEEKAVDDPPLPPPPPAPSAGAASPESAPEGLRWVRVVMFAGNLEVRVDESLGHPVTEGEVTLTQEGENYVVRQVRKGDFLSNLLSQRNVEVTLPAGHGLELDVKGGNVDLYDVPFLKGKMLAGNLDARALVGIRLDMKAGNLDASLRLTEGEHRLDLKAGNGELCLLPGSSVAVSGEVKAGGVETRGGAFVFERGTVGGSFRGTVGAGRASLKVNQLAGNLELAVGDA